MHGPPVCDSRDACSELERLETLTVGRRRTNIDRDDVGHRSKRGQTSSNLSTKGGVFYAVRLIQNVSRGLQGLFSFTMDSCTTNVITTD